mgnify:CR=1 FL=1
MDEYGQTFVCRCDLRSTDILYNVVFLERQRTYERKQSRWIQQWIRNEPICLECHLIQNETINFLTLKKTLIIFTL